MSKIKNTQDEVNNKELTEEKISELEDSDGNYPK